MGYKTGSLSHFYDAASGGDFSVTIASAGAVGDVFVALASHDLANGAAINSVGSTNISWQLAEAAPHGDNSQNFEVWIGRVTTAFSANTEVVTCDLNQTSVAYRDLSVAGWEPEAGYEFPASGYFADATDVTHAANNAPTTTDGYTTTPSLGAVNAKWLLIGWMFVESTTISAANVSSGTNYTQRAEYEIFGAPECIANLADRIYDGATDQAITATCTVQANYMSSLVGLAIKQTPTATNQAVRIDSAADRFNPSQTSLPSSGAFTIFGRARRVADTGTYSCLFLLRNSSSASYLFMGTDSDGDSLKSFNSSGNSANTVATLANDEWFDWAYVTSGSAHTIYYKAFGATSWTTSSGGSTTIFSPDQFFIGNNDVLSQPFNGRITDIRVWSAALNGNELLDEANSVVAARSANLWAEYRTEDVGAYLNDSSGNGRTATGTGTLTLEDGPTSTATFVTQAFLTASATALSSYSSNWTDDNNRFALLASSGGIQSVSQVVAIAFYNAATFADDQYAEIELLNPSGGTDYIGPAVRCSSGGNGYWFYAALGAGLWYFGKLESGSYTTLDSGSTSGWSAGDVLRIEAEGTTLRLKRNGTQIGSDYTNRTEFSSGRPGISGYHNVAGTGTNGRYWEGGDLEATAQYPTLSAAELINLLNTQATPRVTVDVP